MNTSLRMLTKRPWLSLLGIVALSLGIGAVTFAFSFKDALVYRPFRFVHEERVVQIWETNPGLPSLSSTSGNRRPLPPADFLDLKSNLTSFESIAAFRLAEFAIPNPDGPGWEQGTLVTPDFFKTLQDPPAAGRVLEQADFTPGSDPVIVVDNNLSRRLYNSEANAVGKTLTLNYKLNPKIVGAMGPDFTFPPVGNRLLVPLKFEEQETKNRSVQNLFVIARLKADVSIEQAEQELASFSSKLEQQYPQTNAGRKMIASPLIEWESGYFKGLSNLYMFGAFALLILGCATVAGLVIAKATSDRSAAGWISRRTDVAGFGVVLAFIGGVAGTTAAYFAIETLRTSMVENISWFYFGWKYMHLDSHALLVAIGTTIAAAVIIGIFAALLSSFALAPRRKAIFAFAIVQCISAFVLLTAGTVMRKNTMDIVWQYESHDPENVLTAGVALPVDKYANQAERTAFYTNVTKSVGELGEVESAAVSDSFIGTLRRVISKPFEIVGREVPSNPMDLPAADIHTVSAGFFQTMHIPIIGGRSFNPQDNTDAPPVIVINESMAQRYFPGEDPIGKQIHVGLPNDSTYGTRPVTIIGIVPNLRQFWMMPDVRPKIYFHSAQQTLPEVWLLVRTKGDPMTAVPDVRKKVFSVDSERPLYGPRSWYRASIFENLFPPLNFARILIYLGAIGIFFAAIALYTATLVSVSGRNSAEAGKPAFATALGLLLLGAGLGISVTLLFRSDISAALIGVGQFTLSPFVVSTLSLLVIGAIGSYLATRTLARRAPVIQQVAKAS